MIDIDELEGDMVDGLVKALQVKDKAGEAIDVRVVGELRGMLGQIRDRQAVSSMGVEMKRLAGRPPVELAEYFGRNGESRSRVALVVGHELTAEEGAAFERGRHDRVLEVRVIELDRVKRGGKIEPWMTR